MDGGQVEIVNFQCFWTNLQIFVIFFFLIWISLIFHKNGQKANVETGKGNLVSASLKVWEWKVW